MPETSCPTGDCTFRTESQAAMDIHQMGHRIDGLQDGQIAIAREVAAIPGSVAQHFHRTIDDLEPAHTHLTDVMNHAEEGDC